MSLIKIRAALETALNTLSPALETAWENASYNPVSGIPYQEVFIDPLKPDNIEIGGVYEQSGILNINLRYPLQKGTYDAATRAELISNLFKRGASFSNGGMTVTINNTTHIGKGAVVEDRWFMPIRVFFHAYIF